MPVISEPIKLGFSGESQTPINIAGIAASYPLYEYTPICNAPYVNSVAGIASITGTLSVDGTLSGRPVALYIKSTKTLVATTSSDPLTGVYTFNNLSPSILYFVVGFDPQTGKQADVADNLTAT